MVLQDRNIYRYLERRKAGFAASSRVPLTSLIRNRAVPAPGTQLATTCQLGMQRKDRLLDDLPHPTSLEGQPPFCIRPPREFLAETGHTLKKRFQGGDEFGEGHLSVMLTVQLRAGAMLRTTPAAVV